MSFHRFWAILRKEFRQIWRDRRILFLVTLSPAIMLFTFAYLFAFDAQEVRIGIWDQDQSALSRRLVASLQADSKLLVRGQYNGYPSIYESLTRGEIHLAAVIPPEFEIKIKARERTPLQVIIDGSDAITARQGLGRFRERTAFFEQKYVNSESGQSSPFIVNVQPWYNRDLKSTFAMVPGLIPIVLILPSLAIALAITREKELGSFETLATTPIRGAEYLLGKMVPYIFFGLISALIAVAIAVLWFKIPFRGSAVDLVIMTIFYLFASLGESLFISSLLTSQGTAMRIILLLFFVPSFFLTGVTLPVDTGSGPALLASYLLPATFFVQITRGVILKEMGLVQLASQSLYLFSLGAACLGASLIVFRKQVD